MSNCEEGSGGRGTWPGDLKGIALRSSPNWSLMCCSSSCRVVCSVPVFFSLLFERVPEEACLWSLLRLLRFFILSALLRCASLSLTLFQRSFKPSFSCSSALLHAFLRRHRSLTKCRISLSCLPLCLWGDLFRGMSPKWFLPSSWMT